MGDYGVGSPNCLLLEHWGTLLYTVFDEMPYLVGSAAVSTTYRDVDVRVILNDDAFDATFGPSRGCHNENSEKWTSLMTALSLWGQKVTGLPIDFQVQRHSNVAEADWEKRRLPIGMKALRVNCSRCEPGKSIPHEPCDSTSFPEGKQEQFEAIMRAVVAYGDACRKFADPESGYYAGKLKMSSTYTEIFNLVSAAL